MKLRICLFTVLLLPLSAAAQDLSVKPGLWEHNLSIKSASGRLEMALEAAKMQMAMLPPEQRQAVNDMLARQGIRMDLANQSFQNCITEEEAASGEFTFAEDGGCEQTSVTNAGDSTYVSFVCAQGEGELELKNGSEYTGSSSMHLELGTISEDVTAVHNGRWLGASCAAMKD